MIQRLRKRRRNRLYSRRVSAAGWRWRWRLGSLREVTQVKESESFEIKLRRLEAVLFMAREPLTTRKLAKFAQLQDGNEARKLVRELNQQYDAVGRAFRVESVAGGFQLRTRPQFADWLRRLGLVRPPLRLSAPAMETLAIVAYRQPVLRAEVEAIRGVQCTEMLKQLMNLDLVRVAGRSDELGRPYLYGTTRYFLEVFGLRSLDQLPKVNIFRQREHDDTLENAQPQPAVEPDATDTAE